MLFRIVGWLVVWLWVDPQIQREGEGRFVEVYQEYPSEFPERMQEGER